jgi:hypothetical protein
MFLRGNVVGQVELAECWVMWLDFSGYGNDLVGALAAGSFWTC